MKALHFCHVLHFDTSAHRCSYLGAEFSPLYPQETMDGWMDGDGSSLRVNVRTLVSQFFLFGLC